MHRRACAGLASARAPLTLNDKEDPWHRRADEVGRGDAAKEFAERGPGFAAAPSPEGDPSGRLSKGRAGGLGNDHRFTTPLASLSHSGSSAGGG